MSVTTVSYFGPRPPIGEPISLYLDLAPGEKADLEVVARASLAFAAAIKEAAFVLDPTLAVHLELTSGTEGSLSLNSVIRSVKDSATDRDTLKTIAILVSLWFMKETANWAHHRVLDALSKNEAAVGLTPVQQQRIAARVVTVLNGKVAEQELKTIYAELERDRSITGVGASTLPGVRPAEIVPRSEFAARSSTEGRQVDTLDESTRETTARERVNLISPVLTLANRDRVPRRGVTALASS
jgi:hypothetical protein